MAETSLPWAGLISEGAAGDAGGYSDAAFASLFSALIEERTGVIGGLVVKAASPAGAKVVVTAGKAIVKGRLYVLDADTELTISANTSGNNRIDRVVVRADYAAQTIRAVVKTGTPAGRPSAPSLTQSAGVLWELSLATVDADNGFSSIVDADIHRDRVWARDEAPGDRHTSWNPNLEATGLYYKADGRAVSRTTDADLFDVLGTTHGVGDGSTTFNLPEENGRVFAAMDNQGTAEGSSNVVTNAAADTLGGKLGTETHTLATTEMPAHNHTGPVGTGSKEAYGGSGNVMLQSSTVTGSAGGGQAHNNMQPTIFGYAYIRR